MNIFARQRRIQDNPSITTVAAGETFIVGDLDSAGQLQALTAILAANDAANPVPYTATPPYGEPDLFAEPDDTQAMLIVPPADMDGTANVDLESVLSDAPTSDIPEWDWENDGQYFGLGVPPGVPNWGQPIESGHSQITPPNPAAEVGWDEWSGKPKLARVARQFNDFHGYGKGTSRGHMIDVKALQNRNSAQYRTQQSRDLMLAEIQRRGLHNRVLITPDVPAYSDMVAQYVHANADNGELSEAGVL